MKPILLIPFQILLLSGITYHAGASPPVIETLLDDSADSMKTANIRTPYHLSKVTFRISAAGERYRYQLKGLDGKWVAEKEPMNFIVRFYDSKGDQTEQQFFPVTGDSPGWTGKLETAPFKQRMETVTVPESAERFSIVISSSGPPHLLGVYAVKSMGIKIKSPSSEGARLIMTDSKLGAATPSQLWSKSGIHPTMALSTGFAEGDSPVFILRDDDITAHADWLADPNLLPAVTPGDKLEITWEEAFSIGIGGKSDQEYSRIPPGEYRFLAETLSTEGLPTGKVSSVTLTVPLAYWKSVWFWSLIILAIAAAIYYFVRREIRRKINRKLRHAQLISDERLRIARDLHDDLGTRLCHIYLLGSHSETISTAESAKSNFKEITTMAGELIAALSETVWLLNSNNNNLESLVNFLCRVLGELCKLSGKRCRIDALSVGQAMPVSHEFRHNFSLAVKEAIHNALKHSSATEIGMAFSLTGDVLKISISDNGTGMACAPGHTGTGLASIAQRMDSIEGNFSVGENPGGGVRISLEAPIRT